MINPASVPSATQTATPPPAPAGPEVLVVEDAEEIRDLLTALLLRHGCRVRAVAGGFAARNELARARPALVVTDLHMPDGDGWDLLAHCRHHAPDVPVLVVSGQGWGTQPHVEAWAAGFVAKPFSVERFTRTVDRLLSRASARVSNHTSRAA